MSRGDTWRAGLCAAVVFIGGLFVYALLREMIARVRLTAAFIVAVCACSVYGALAVLNRSHLTRGDDALAYWANRVFGLAMLFVGLRLLDRLVVVPVLTRGGRQPVPRLIHQIVNLVLAGFGLMIYGSYAFNWNIDKFLAGSAVVSIALGLALQESLGNFFSGLVMQGNPPFAIGDWIICGSYQGRVVDMTWRAVTLHTNDDNYVVIPNGTIAKQEITNFHCPTVATARVVKVGLEYNIPPCDALEVLQAAAAEVPSVLAKPAPVAVMLDYGDSSIVYGVKFWINDPQRHVKAEHDVRVSIWYRLRQHGYDIPFPMRTVEQVDAERKAEQEARQAGERRQGAISAVPLLAALSAEEKARLAARARDVLLATGQVLFRQNEPGETFYIICKGRAEVLVEQAVGDLRPVATLSSGDFFGEMSALTGQPRTATIRAAAPLALVEIGKADLQAIFEANPAVLEQISQVIAQRNAERQAILQGPAAAAAADTKEQQQSLLGRMMRFFGLGAGRVGATARL